MICLDDGVIELTFDNEGGVVERNVCHLGGMWAWGLSPCGTDSYVFLDAFEGTLVQISSEGNVLWQCPLAVEEHAGQLTSQARLDNPDVLVTVDSMRQRIVLLDTRTGALLRTLREGFGWPVGAVQQHGGLTYFADHRTPCVVVMAGDGTIVHRIGSDSTPGQIINPRSIAVDRAGNVLVADNGREEVVVFAVGGAVHAFPVPDSMAGLVVDKEGRLIVLTSTQVLLFQG